MHNWQKWKTSYQEDINGGSPLKTLQIKDHKEETRMAVVVISGKSSATVVMKRGTWLVAVHRSHNNLINGNHIRVPVATDKQRWKNKSKYSMQYVMTAQQNREPKIGSPTMPMNRTRSNNLSCSKSWEGDKERIFEVVKPRSLGKSFML